MTTTHNGVPPVPAVDEPTDDAVTAGLAQALRAVRLGRFDTRLPRGLSREVVEEFDALVGLLERRNRDLLRIGRVVGREGRMLERLNEEAYDGAWAEGVHAVNALIDDLGQSAAETARVIEAVAQGDLSQHMALEIAGRPLRGSSSGSAGRSTRWWTSCRRSPTRSPGSPARSASTGASAGRPRCAASRARGATSPTR